MIGVLVKRVIYGILARVVASVIKHEILMNIWIINNSKLILECKDEILNTTETLIDHKKVTYKKNICLN